MKMEHSDQMRELQKRNHLKYSTMVSLALSEYLINEKERLDQLENIDKSKKKK